MDKRIGSGGFFFPKVYRESKSKVMCFLKQGIQDLVESSRWSFADEFIAFILGLEFLKFADNSYPNPRKKNEVPVWFMISCQLILKIHLEKSYNALGTLLKSGPLLSKVGFNVGAKLGFNDKNKGKRETAVHPDTVRKFFKDIEPKYMRKWFNVDLQRWFKKFDCFDSTGVYLLDQTHLVVPKNDSYTDAVYMPVDEHGQRYKGMDEMTEEQKKALKRHPCYTLSTLLHLSYKKQAFHIAGYDFGPGNEDELPQAENIINDHFKNNGKNNKKEAMKLLIVDRGYLSGEFITKLKKEYNVDVLIPLRKNMTQHQDAVAISEMPETKWVTVSQFGDQEDYKITKACTIDDICLWDKCKVPLYITVVEIEQTTGDDGGIQTNKFSLCSTRKFDTPHKVVDSYRLRTRIEECFRQFKNAWKINDFSSPHASLLEAHVGFTLATYSLLQLHLLREDLQKKTRKMITTLKREEHKTDKSIIVYADNYFAPFSMKEYLLIINNLSQEVRKTFTDSLQNSIHQD